MILLKERYTYIYFDVGSTQVMVYVPTRGLFNFWIYILYHDISIIFFTSYRSAQSPFSY